MSTYGVGEFGKFRRTIRAPVNPLDVSTIVSILPKEIDERKPTIEPGRFIIPKGSYENPSILVVGTSSWWKETDPDQPMLEIPHSSVVVANSVVLDCVGAMFMCDMASSMPGLFYLPGRIEQVVVKTVYKKQLDEANVKQRNWYLNLVKAADSLWARSNGNPLAISDDMRLAAESLNLKDKAWMQDFTTMELVNCPACGYLVKPGFPICSNCRTIVNKKLYDDLKLVQAS